MCTFYRRRCNLMNLNKRGTYFHSIRVFPVYDMLNFRQLYKLCIVYSDQYICALSAYPYLHFDVLVSSRYLTQSAHLYHLLVSCILLMSFKVERSERRRQISSLFASELKSFYIVSLSSLSFSFSFFFLLLLLPSLSSSFYFFFLLFLLPSLSSSFSFYLLLFLLPSISSFIFVLCCLFFNTVKFREY